MSEETAELRAEVRELRAELIGLRDLLQGAPPRITRIARREGESTGGTQDTIFQTGTLQDRQSISDVNAVMLKPPQLLLFEQDGKWFGIDPTGDPDGDGGSDEESCECKLITLLAEHNHLEDISDEDWGELQEHCACVTFVECPLCVDDKMPETVEATPNIVVTMSSVSQGGVDLQTEINQPHDIKMTEGTCRGEIQFLDTVTTEDHPPFQPIGTEVTGFISWETLPEAVGNVGRLHITVFYGINQTINIWRDTDDPAAPGDKLECAETLEVNSNSAGTSPDAGATWTDPAVVIPTGTINKPPPSEWGSDGGDWVAQGDGGVGSDIKPVDHLIVGTNSTGFSQGALLQREGGGLLLAGQQPTAGPASLVPRAQRPANAPVELAGNQTLISAETYFMEVHQQLLGTHQLTLGPSVLSVDGRLLSPIQVGPELNFANEQFAADNRLIQLNESGPLISIMSLTTNFDYPVGSLVGISLLLEETGGRETIFNIVGQAGGVEVFREEISLQGQQLQYDTTQVTVNPVANGVLVEFFADYTQTHQQSNGRIRGDVKISRLDIRAPA